MFENCNLGMGFEVVETKLVLFFIESRLVGEGVVSKACYCMYDCLLDDVLG